MSGVHGKGQMGRLGCFLARNAAPPSVINVIIINAVAVATVYLTLLLMPAKRAAHLKKT